MSIVPIVAVPDPVLSKQCRDLAPEEFNEDLKSLVQDMYETMAKAEGVGLAAPQIGKDLRLFVVDVTSQDPDVKPFAVVNPKVLRKQGEQEYEEGCLSAPGYFSKMKRSAEIDIEFKDENGEDKKLEAKGFLAIVLQHELDHIDGRTIVSYASAMKQKMIIKKVQKWISRR